MWINTARGVSPAVPLAQAIPEGLTDEQAERARETYGANTLTRRARRSFWRQYLTSFGDPIIRILLVALGVNLVFLLSASFSWYEPAG
ncbi:MAG: cation-transporting P-type ATPase, partial [Defluviitaleaceae bacterium]|nr:cation-transporting P-type ATPase [Defluviitaleaceae bacterium]